MSCTDPTYQVYIGDCLDRLRSLETSSVDSIVTDPPYGLGFMGKKWDIGVPPVDVFAECLRVLKPGGHLLAFGGSRTYHRLAVAVEDAGFDIRDQIMWVYGSGFPKSQNVGKAIDKAAQGNTFNDDAYVRPAGHQITAPAQQWDGWGTALKPAHEPIVVARKPLAGTVAANVQEHGTGALNIDNCRVGAGTGRWPANFIHDGSEQVVSAFPYTQSGKMKAGTRRAAQDTPGSVCYGTYGGNATAADTIGDAGPAARFFYCAKASKADRTERGAVENGHPTVKPTELMRYLCRLVTPPGGTVLDPFMGSGTTGKAALKEGFGFIGIEKEPEYAAIAEERLATFLSGEVSPDLSDDAVWAQVVDELIGVSKASPSS